MPYYRCPGCGLSAHSAAGHFTANTCPNCAGPLADADRIHMERLGPTAITRHLVAVPHSASVARRALDALLPDPADAEFEIAALLITELIANSVEHSGTSPRGIVRLDIEASDDLLRVEVRDEGPGFVPAARTADSPLDSHWGLHLIGELAARWGAGADPDTMVWFELARAAPSRAETKHFATARSLDPSATAVG
jgi:anti-sigma regulatory factor (Ser/Thr protein kinase)